MKSNCLLISIIILSAFITKAQTLSDKIADHYCQEISLIDTLNKDNFEQILPELDQKIIFGQPDWILVIAKETKDRNMTLKAFYEEVYAKFSKTCPAYQAMYRSQDVQLQNADYFVGAYCECFDEKTQGRIDSEDLTPVMKACNDELSKDKTYKKNVKKELKNKSITRELFSKTMTAHFLTECDLIVNHLFNYRVKMMVLQSELKLQEWRINQRRY
jgi:hypothetical protein